MLRFPVVRFASLLFRLLGDTTGAAGSFRFSCRHRLPSDKPGVGYPVPPSGIMPWKRQGLPSSWGTPRFICVCSSTPVGHVILALNESRILLPLKRKRKLRRVFLFRGSIASLLNSLSTLRKAGYPDLTQDSLPAAGWALPGGITPLGSCERFQVINA